MPEPTELQNQASWVQPVLGVLLLLAVALVVYLRFRLIRLQKANSDYLQEKRAVYAFLNKIGERMSAHLDLDETLREILAFLVEDTRAQAGAIFLIDRDHKSLSARVLVGMFPPFRKTIDYALTKTKFLHERMKRDRIPIGEGIIGEVAATGEPCLIANARIDERIPQTPGFEIETLIVTPLFVEERVEGVFALVNRAGGEPFSETDLSVLRALAEQAGITIQTVQLYDALAEQHRIDQELRLATDFQRMLLPKKCPEIPGVDIAAASRPAMEVGGDFYDFFWLAPDRLGIVIADVSGKGIPGALIMSMVRSVMRAESVHARSPSAVLERVNQTMLSDTRENVFITMIYGVLDLSTQTLTFARAGHEPVVAYSTDDTGMRLLTPDGIALGLVDEKMFAVISDQDIPLHNGDLLVLYTDGVVEARNRESEEYGQERFLETIRAHAGQSPGELIETLVGDVDRFARDGRQSDDITLVVVKINNLASPAESLARPDQEGKIESI